MVEKCVLEISVLSKRSSFSKIILTCCVLWGLFVFSASVAVAENPPVENEALAIGRSAIFGGNVAAAKEKAISEALVRGVETYLFHRLGPEGTSTHFQRLVEEVIPQAKKGVENFHILAEKRFGNSYVVLVKMRVNEKILDEMLGESGLRVEEGPPLKVLFLVTERSGGKTSYWWKDPETARGLTATDLSLYKVFQEKGFSPVNRSVTVPERGNSAAMKLPRLSAESALEWGRLYSADVVVYGQTEILDGREVSAALTALNVAQGVQLCEESDTRLIEKGEREQEKERAVLEGLIKDLAQKMSVCLVRGSDMDRSKVHSLIITLEQLKSYRQSRLFMDFLRNVSGVKSVKQTRIRHEAVSMAVEFSGDRDRFLDQILNQQALPFPVELDRAEEKGESEEIVLVVRE
jgi:hypothetical protein